MRGVRPECLRAQRCRVGGWAGRVVLSGSLGQVRVREVQGQKEEGSHQPPPTPARCLHARQKVAVTCHSSGPSSLAPCGPRCARTYLCVRSPR